MEVNQRNLMAGNYIDVMGTFQIVLGIVFRDNWFIQHTAIAFRVPVQFVEPLKKLVKATVEKWLCNSR